MRHSIPCLALLLTGCGALSTHQSPKLLDNGHTAWIGGLGLGDNPHCADTSGNHPHNGCVLTADPFIAWRYGAGNDTAPVEHGVDHGEFGLKASGIPFLGGTFVADLRLQALSGPLYLSYDFGISVFPCISGKEEGEDDESCRGNPFGAGTYAGATAGWDWLHAGAKFQFGGNSWDGMYLLPGVTVGSALGPRRFKVMPSIDVYFYQWPLDLKPELRVIYGLGFMIGT